MPRRPQVFTLFRKVQIEYQNGGRVGGVGDGQTSLLNTIAIRVKYGLITLNQPKIIPSNTLKQSLSSGAIANNRLMFCSEKARADSFA